MKRYLARDALGTIHWVQVVPNDQYIEAPPFVTRSIRDGLWSLYQDEIPDPPPEIMDGWHRPDWRAVSAELYTALSDLRNYGEARLPESLDAAVNGALDGYRVALMAHEEAVVPPPPPPEDGEPRPVTPLQEPDPEEQDSDAEDG